MPFQSGMERVWPFAWTSLYILGKKTKARQILPARHTEASAASKHKKVARIASEQERVDILFQSLSKYDDWIFLQDDPDLKRALWSRYSTLRRLWEDSQQKKRRRNSTTESTLAYLWDKEWPEAQRRFRRIRVGEKYLLPHCFGINLVWCVRGP